MSMTKLIGSSMLPAGLDTSIQVLEDPAAFTKIAADTGQVFDYEALKPDKDHVGIHLIALGATETYGLNRNGDSFPKEACVKYHDTFPRCGHVYESHANKNPDKARGIIKASAWNEDMQRIELFIHAHKDKAKVNLEKMAREGTHPYSMACKVPGDRCTICDTFRKSASDTNQCDHVANQLGKMAEDGSIVGTHNDDPKFFDISFVFRPADRIAWDVKVASALGEVMDSVKMAEVAGVYDIDTKLSLPDTARKFTIGKKLASVEHAYYGLMETGIKTACDKQMKEITKASQAQLSDGTIELLRQYEPNDVFYSLAENQVVMDVDSYCKYAMGLDYGELKEHMPAIKQATATIFSDLQNSNELEHVCNDTIYNVDVTALCRRPADLQGVYKEASFCMEDVSLRSVAFTLDGGILRPVTYSGEKVAGDKNVGSQVAKKYAAYKIASMHAMSQLHPDVDDRHFFLAIAQNLVTNK